MLIVVDTPGWASLGFASIKGFTRLNPTISDIPPAGKMHPSDAVLGWIEDNGTHHIQSYHITVHPEYTCSNRFPPL